MPDIIDKFSSNLKNVLTRALCFAVETQKQMILPEYLLWALGTQKGCVGAEILKKVGLKSADLKKLIEGIPVTKPLAIMKDTMMLQLSNEAKRVVEKAVLVANMYGHKYIGTEHLLSGIVQVDIEKISRFFYTQKTDVVLLREQIAMVLKHTSKFPDMTELIQAEPTPQQQPLTTTQEDHAPDAFPALSYFARELTSEKISKKIDPVIGREQEIERLMEILCRRTKNNPLLVGEPGVGKTAVVEGLAKKIFDGAVPIVLQQKRVFALDLTQIVAGTMYRGEFEGRLRQIIDEVQKSDDVILFIDELHTIIGAGSASGSMDAANILKPALARGDLHCIGATTSAEFKKYIESDRALERRFQPLFIEEPTEQVAMDILAGIAPHYESFHGVRITPDAIEEAVKLSSRYVTNRHLPDKAIDLLDEASASARLQRTDAGPLERKKSIEKKMEGIREEKRQTVIEERFLDAVDLKATEDLLAQERDALTIHSSERHRNIITSDEIARIISRVVGIPLEDLLKRDQESHNEIEQKLKERVLGQDAVIARVAGALRRAKSGIAHPQRPLASFLFLGPSGVGKTELAKSIAEHVFHGIKNLIRLDMSEYAEGFTTSKLIGAPAGYVGYKDHANLTDRVQQRPYSVVLFDEIEKAHRDVQNLLLQILEEGELADATGKMVNFKNTVVILTSNVGLERFEQGGIGFHGQEAEIKKHLSEDIEQELKERFRPELLNRLDHICMFEPLSQDVLEQICKKQLQELQWRVKEQGVSITWKAETIRYMLARVEPKSGARSIRHLIQTQIESLLAERLMQKDHPKHLSIAVDKEEVCVRKSR